ncbi:hypothetical protein HS7_12060 [Sulfolobales archaeon HS-7]|nr:hypothetical protein HS7_12060 [Sulfolobales archaeon HS-7]
MSLLNLQFIIMDFSNSIYVLSPTEKAVGVIHVSFKKSVYFSNCNKFNSILVESLHRDLNLVIYCIFSYFLINYNPQ